MGGPIRKPELVPMVASLAAVATAGSIRGAANALELAKGTVSRHIQVLEAHFGAALLHRSPRSLQLTREGEALLTLFGPIAQSWNSALEQVTADKDGARGIVRVTAPDILCRRLLAPAIRSASEIAPGITVELNPSDRLVPLIDVGVDLAVRTSPLPDAEFAQVKLFKTREVAVSAPAIAPRSFEELVSRPWVFHSVRPDGGSPRSLDSTGRLANVVCAARTSSSERLLDLLLEGVGIGLMPRAFILDYIKDGRLVEFEFHGRDIAVHLLTTGGRLVPTRVRVVAEVIKEASKRLVAV